MPGVPTCLLQAMFSEGPGGAPFSGVHLVFVRAPSIKKKMDFILRPKMSSKILPQLYLSKWHRRTPAARRQQPRGHTSPSILTSADRGLYSGAFMRAWELATELEAELQLRLQAWLGPWFDPWPWTLAGRA